MFYVSPDNVILVLFIYYYSFNVDFLLIFSFPFNSSNLRAFVTFPFLNIAI